MVAAPQVPHHFGHFIDVAGCEAFLVCLESAGPVAGFFHIGFAQEAEDFPQPGLAHDVAHADRLGVLRGYPDYKIGLVDLQHEVFQGFTTHFPLFDRFDHGSTMMGINNSVAHLEFHKMFLPKTVTGRF